MADTINLGPGSVLYDNEDTAKENCPGRGYSLQSNGRFWWWQVQLVDPYQALISRIEELERRIAYLENNQYSGRDRI